MSQEPEKKAEKSQEQTTIPAEKSEARKNEIKKDKPTKEEYSRVVFQEKYTPGQPDEVMLSVNGEVLIIQRGVETIVPKKHLEVADHSLERKFSQSPDQPRKFAGMVKRYQYTYLGPATKKEYDAMKKLGTEKTRDSMRSIMNRSS